MLKRLQTFFSLLVLVGITIPAYGANHYVDKNLTSGSNNGSSWANAWHSFSAISWGSIQPGDNIYISGGTDSTTYNENLTIGASGNANGLIVIRPGLEAGHNGKVIISVGGTPITINAKKYIKLEKLTVKMDHNNGTGISLRGSSVGAVNVIYIDSCRVLDIWANSASNTNTMHLDGYIDGSTTGGLDSIFVRHCYLEVYRATPTTVQTDNLVMQFCTNVSVIEDTILVNNDALNGDHNDCIATDHTITNLTIAKCYLLNKCHNDPFGHDIIVQSLIGNFELYDNVIAQPYGQNIGSQWGTILGIWNNQVPANVATFHIYNNTFIGGAQGYFINNQLNDNSTFYMKNNIFYAILTPTAANVRIHFVNSAPTAANIDGNFYSILMANGSNLINWHGSQKTMSALNTLGAETYGTPANRWNHNPHLTDPSNFNYSELSDSPTIDGGITMGGNYNVDILGVPRPQGNGNDMGAYEYINNNENYIIVNTGWNCISVPKLSENMTADYLLPTRTSPVFEYNGSGYQNVNNLQNGKGYIVKFSYPQFIFIGGNSVSFPIQVNAGWNLIGPFNQNVPVSQIYTVPSGIIVSDFYGVGEYGYLSTNVLEIGKGYWIKTTSSGQIILNGSSLGKNGIGQQQSAEIDPNWGKIKITDSEGKSITLYAAGTEIKSDIFGLPPLPPAGIFDTRYSSGRFVENLSTDNVIMINSDKYPIKIKAEGIIIFLRDRINGEIINKELNDGDEIAITNEKITSLVVTGKITEDQPVSYQLYQNYPNPFNPVTTIRFAIPKETQVNLSVFNILGEKVKELKNAVMKPGNYTFEFNASTFASGVYIYRIETDSFTDTKKMILIK